MTSTTHGQKVTTDPASYQNPVQEGAGVITSDSLAAESMNQGGEFAEGNKKAAVSGQSSTGTTANNKDTSGAVKLDAAPDAEARAATEEWSESAQLNAAKGLGKEGGVGPTYNTKQSSTSTSTSSSTGGGFSGATRSEEGSYAATAGTDAPTSTIDLQSQEPRVAKPTEKITGEEPNTSFTTEIGSKNDPGLLGERKFEALNAEDPRDSGMKRDGGMVDDGKGGFENLKDNVQA